MMDEMKAQKTEKEEKGVKFTPEQRAAIEAKGSNLLVSAAAGSGKTAVLVERIMEHVLHDKWNVDDLLVVTFTRAAASEMKGRIGERIHKELARGDLGAADRAHLEEQLLHLPNAMIMTFDSFCLNIIRKNFAAIDLSPDFRQASDQEDAIMRDEAMRMTLDDAYDEGDASFIHLANGYSDFRGSEGLADIIRKVHRFSESQPFPEAWIRSLSAEYQLEDNVSITKTKWWNAMRDDVLYIAEDAHDTAKSMCKYVDENGLTFYHDGASAIEGFTQKIEKTIMRDDVTWEELRACCTEKMPALGRAKNGTPKELKAPAQDAQKAIQKKLDNMASYFALSEQDVTADIKALEPDVTALCDVTRKYRDNLQSMKKAANVVDFPDLEHMALDFLATEETHGKPIAELVPTDAATELRDKFKEVMVDEYQDTNGVQEAILHLVSRGDNLFTVGDAKQSIYRFRLADPQLFIAKEKAYGTLHQIRLLTKNFRSRREVLASINFLFAQILPPQKDGEKPLEIEYNKNAMLHAGFEYESGVGTFGGAPIELLLIDGAGDDDSDGNDGSSATSNDDNAVGFAAQAEIIAQRIIQIKNSGVTVKGEKIRNKDFAVLFRSGQDKIALTQKILASHGIKSYAEQSEGYWSSPEVTKVLALLRIIDNAEQDIPLASVLLSPVAGLTYDELAALRVYGDKLHAKDEPRVSLMGIIKSIMRDDNAQPPVDMCIGSGLREKLEHFLQKLADWRDKAPRYRLDDFIWMIYRDTSCYDYFSEMDDGVQKKENLRLLADRAAAFEANGSHGLYRFIRYIDRLLEAGEDNGGASVISETDDVVKLMTIHKSKGLEFPVVILADVGKQINMTDTKETLLIHPKYGIGAKCIKEAVDEEGDYRMPFYYGYPSFPYRALAGAIRRENLAEEMRVLYVALTRAREKLIIVGGVNDVDKGLKKWSKLVKDDARPGLSMAGILSAETYLDWLMPAAMRHPSGGKELREQAECSSYVPPKFDEIYGEDFSSEFDLSVAVVTGGKKRDIYAEPSTLSEDEKNVKPQNDGADDWQYDAHGLDEVPTKLSISEMKRRFAAVGRDEETKAGVLTRDYDDVIHVTETNKDNECDVEEEPQEKETVGIDDSDMIEMFPTPDFAETDEKASKKNAASYGTMIHAIMQHLDFSGEITAETLKSEIVTLSQRGIIDKDAPSLVRRRSIDAILRFGASPLAARMGDAMRRGRLWREQQFSRLIPAQRFFERTDDQERIFTQGIIDAMFYDEARGGIVLIDYKTDKDTRPDVARERHKFQIGQYRETIEAILKKRVIESYLVMLSDGSIVGL